MDRRRLLGIILVACSACGFGSGPLFAKSVYAAGLDWLVLQFWRFFLAALLIWLWALLVPANRAALRALPRRRLIALLGLGVFMVSNTSTYYAALQYISASLTALIIYIYPALVAVLSIRIGHGLQGRRPWGALGIVSVGVALTLGGIQTRAEPIGIVLAFISPCLYAVYIVLTARLAGERRGETASDRTGGRGAETRPAVVLAVIASASCGVLALMAAISGAPIEPWRVPGSAWFGLVGIAGFSTALAFTAFYAGAARIGAAQGALVSTIEPVWTITLATLFFGERLSPIQLLGGLLVMVGVVVAQSTPAQTLAAVVVEPEAA